MEKLKMHSGNVTSSNIEALAQIFPDCITEATDENGQVIQAVDFDKLKATLSSKIVEGSQERYNLTWPQKSDAIRLANARTSKTLRPCREESLDFDNTGNLYIEGDNLDVLKVLRNTYRSRVKMIYIDPPYNTGNDFVYEDDFTMDSDEFLHLSGQKDNDGNRLVVNSNSNGRFHTDWLNMIYPRLKVARDLLTDDGVIFISIDDHEVENLKKVCCEIFGDNNFVAQFIWERAYSPKNDAKYVSVSHDYVLMFAKNISSFVIGRPPRTEKMNTTYKNPDNDPRGVWMSDNLSVKSYSPSTDYTITTPAGRSVSPPPGGCWRVSKDTYERLLADNRIWFGAQGDGVPRLKRFLSELKKDGMTPTSILFYKDVGHSQDGAKELNELMGLKVFDGPKPLKLLEHLITLANLNDEDIVLDFFAGSSSTAHALMQHCIVKKKHNKFVLVQIPEPTDNKSPAFNAGYNNICEIGKERIRRAGAKIKSEFGDQAKDLDVGFRVLKLDSSNMEDAFYLPNQMTMESLVSDNIKQDRTSEDLLFQTMLETDVLLSSSISVEHINNKEVFIVRDGYLMACFDEQIDLATVKAIAERKPVYFITRDGSMASDDVADNMEQIFMAISPNTTIKVL